MTWTSFFTLLAGIFFAVVLILLMCCLITNSTKDEDLKTVIKVFFYSDLFLLVAAGICSLIE